MSKVKSNEPNQRPTRNDAQRQSILDAASLLFIEKGFGGTNINDIADAVGVTRTALYYYFPSKVSILEALTKEVTERASELARSISKRGEMPADEALRQLVLQHAGLILSHPLHFRVAERSESSLPQPHRAAAQASRRALLDHFLKVIERGVNQGKFRVANAHIAAFSIIGMCNWSAWWFDPEGEVSAEGVAAMMAEFALHGVTAAPFPGQATTDPIDQLREALTVLESRRKVREVRK